MFKFYYSFYCIIFYFAGSMTSSSSCSSNIQTRFGPIDGDVLWMQPKHVSEHVWNGKPNRKLYIIRVVPTYQGGVLFVNKSSSRVSLRWLGRGNQHIGNDDLRVFRRKLDIMKQHEFVWEPYTTTVMAALPLICVVGSVAWFAVVPLICFHVVEWHQLDRVLRQFGLQQPIPGCPSQPQNLHGITLKGKQDENWFQLLAPIISQWNNRVEFRVDVYPRHEGLLSFNSDYMVWYRHKTKMFVDPNNANIATLLVIISEEQKRITEQVSHGPASEREFPAQEFHILQSSVETRGIGKQREPVEAEEYSQQMMERGHEMYYTPETFFQYPLQMYQYPFEGHHTDTSQHDVLMATPNALFAPQWNVPEAIPNMGDLLGVDLRQEFSTEAEQVKAGRHRGRKNPDRQARRWDRSCGTSSRHHGHHNE
ncbi:Serine/threonine-protein phosphatase 7 long form [Glycine max]|nr:Serine/threonine-protein phosphatase 7 long form [Glycine max]